MDKIDTNQIRSAAEKIQDELNTFKSASNTLNEDVTNLKNNWMDDVNEAFTRRYETDGKQTIQSVTNLIQNYINLLNEVAEKADQLWTNAGTKL